MKHIFLFILVLLTGYRTFAQSTPNDPTEVCEDFSTTSFIRTNPSQPIPSVDIPKPYRVNTFDWTQSTFPFRYGNTVSTYQTPGTKLNPFWSTDYALAKLFAHGPYSDFYPEDGWELVGRNFGYLMRPGQMSFPVTAPDLICPNGDTKFSYFILYNRYTAKLRVFATIPHGYSNNADSVLVTLKFEDPGSMSALLSPSASLGQPLDQKSAITQITAKCFAPGSEDDFIFADFIMGYDPCTCHYPSNLNITFETFSSGRITLTGAGYGVIKSLLEGYDDGNFINKYYQANLNSGEPGSFIASQVGEMYARYMEEAQSKNDFTAAAAFKVLSVASDVGAELAGAYLTGGSTLVTKAALSATVPNEGRHTVSSETNEKAEGMTVEKALGISSKLFEYFSGSLESDKTTEMLPQVLEMEMKLQGTVSHHSDIDHMTISLANPGSLGSEDKAECGTYALPGDPVPSLRPTYNETLGIFSLKNTPKIDLTYNYKVVPNPFTLEDYIGYDVELMMKLTNNLEYFLNPAAGIDLDRTKVRAALVYRPRAWETVQSISNWEGLDPVAPEPSVGANGFITPFVDPSCLNSFTPYIRSQYGTEVLLSPSGNFSVDQVMSGEIFVRFLITYEFKVPGRNGKKKTSYQVITFPVEINEIPVIRNQYVNIAWNGHNPAEYVGFLKPYPSSLNISTTYFTENQTLYAYGPITLSGDLSTAPGVHVNIISSEQINLLPEANLSPDISYYIDNASPSCTYQDLHISDISRRSSFCSDVNLYKANQCVGCNKTVHGNGIHKADAVLVDVTIVNNPSSIQYPISLLYTDSQRSSPLVSLSSSLGRTIPISITGSDGSYQIRHQATAPGVYTLTVTTSQGVQRKRVVLQ